MADAVTTSRVSTREELRGWRDEWEALLDASASDTIFLTWEWLDSWLAAYGAGRELVAIRVDRGGLLVGLAVLVLQREPPRALGGGRSLSFAGDGTADSDYLDLVSRRGEEATVVDAVLRECASLPGWDRLRWNEIPATSPHLRPLCDSLRARRWWVESSEVPCAFTTFPETWDAYVRALKPRMRTKVRSAIREFESEAGAVLERCESEADLPARLESLFDLHRERWRLEGSDGVFVSAEKRRFYEVVSRELLRRGWLRLWSLRVGDRWVAHQYCFERKGTVFLLQEGYDPEWGERGVGNALRAMVFRECVAQGVRVYDFLAGVTPHKLSWGAQVKHGLRIEASPPGWRAATEFVSRRATRWTKERAKRALTALRLRDARE